MPNTTTADPGGPHADAIAQLLAKYADWEREFEARLELGPTPDGAVRLAFEIVHMGKAFEYHLTKAASGSVMTALQARFAWILATSRIGVPMGNLAVELGISLPAVYTMVGRMQERGLVTSETGPGDARCVLVALTQAGREEWDDVRARLADVCAEVRDALGRKSARRFRKDVALVTALDERHEWFERLRNPMAMLS